MTKDKALVRAGERKLVEKEILNKKFKDFDRTLHQLVESLGKLEKRVEELERKINAEISSTPSEIEQGTPKAL